MVQTNEGGYAILGTTHYFSQSHFWLVKTDPSGVTQWNQTYGGSGDDKPVQVVQMTDGSYALAGSTNSYGAGLYDGWLIKTKTTYQFGSIQAAINQANPGDIIHVFAGTYSENVVVNKTVTLVGEDDQTTIIDGGGAGNTLRVTANSAVVTGFSIRDCGSDPEDAGVFLDDVTGVQVYGNTIIANNGWGIYVSEGKNNMGFEQ